MEPLTVTRFCLLLAFASAYNVTQELRELWFGAVSQSNATRLRSHNFISEMDQLMDVLSSHEISEWRFFSGIRDVLRKNRLGKSSGHIKMGVFTNYCGPGHVGESAVCGMFNGIDECCKTHDSCPDVITSKIDFFRFPKLPQREILFTSLSCDCDMEFYNCLKRTRSMIGEMILSIYSIAQSMCFKREQLAEKCLQYDE